MFADADGDAIVNSGDISAVLLNWGKTVNENYYYPWGVNGDSPDCYKLILISLEIIMSKYIVILLITIHTILKIKR